MSGAALIPNEATTEFLAGTEVRDNPAIQLFREGLDSTQRRRFDELAHHLVSLGFDEGLQRPAPLDTDKQAQVLVREATTYAQGAGEALDPSTELKGN